MRNERIGKTATAAALALGMVSSIALMAPLTAAAQQSGTGVTNGQAPRTGTTQRQDSQSGTMQRPDAQSGSSTQHQNSQTGTMQRQGSPATGDSQRSQSAGSAMSKSELMARAGELIGRDVVGANGEEIGELKNIVVGAQQDEPFAVVDVGGFLGMGERSIVIPFNRLEVRQDNVVLMSQSSKDDLRKMPQYREDQYRPLRNGNSPRSDTLSAQPQRTAAAGTLSDSDLRTRADSMIGWDVLNANGEDIGEVEDIVTGGSKNETYAVIDVGGFLGMGERTIVVPFNQLKVGENNVALTAQATREQLGAMPEYRADQYKPFRQRDTAGASTRPDRIPEAAVPGSATTRLWARADELIGRNVVNADGEDVGELEDIVLGRQQDATYAVIAVGGFLGMGERNIVIPFDRLAVGEDTVVLMSQMSEDELKQMPEYMEDEYQPLERDRRMEWNPAPARR